LPEGYAELLKWYSGWCGGFDSLSVVSDPLLCLRGSGRAIWADEHADDYIRRLREGWK